MTRSKDSFYLDKSEPVKSCLLTLRDTILNLDEELRETVKYGMPCFTFRNKPVFYLWTDKKSGEPYVLLVDGRDLEFDELETGTRAKMKILRVDPQADLPIQRIRLILETAIALHKK